MRVLKDSKGRFVAGHKKVGGMSKGDHQTEETKNKISASLIGRTTEQARVGKAKKRATKPSICGRGSITASQTNANRKVALILKQLIKAESYSTSQAAMSGRT